MYPSAQVPRARGGNESNDSGDHNMRKIPDKSDLQFAEQEYYTFSALYSKLENEYKDQSTATIDKQKILFEKAQQINEGRMKPKDFRVCPCGFFI